MGYRKITSEFKIKSCNEKYICRYVVIKMHTLSYRFKSKKYFILCQMYISLIGPRPTEITKSANIILQTYYMMQRKSEYRDPSRTTVRMLDSLIR